MATQAVLPKNNEQIISRPLAEFPPTEWGFSFASFSFPEMEFEAYNRLVEELKPIVMDMLMSSKKDLVQNIEFINLLCRLGVFYHFESAIEEQVNHIYDALPNLLKNNDYPLNTVALVFRVLRQHGYRVSSDVFKTFKESNGEFKKTIANDVKGILSLYEASHLRVHGEQILDEALEFSKTNLETLAMQSSPHLARLIKHALVRPIYKTVQRLDTREFISFYEEEDSRNETLLKFAKLDFNRLQLVYQQELRELSRWWEEINLIQELAFVRDRIVEVYFWMNGTHFEPQYALGRMVATKFGILVTVIDDYYDAYATFEEVQHFTNAINKCTWDAMDELPTNDMKVLYRALLTLFDETRDEVSKAGRSFSVDYLNEDIKAVIKAFFIEARWFNENVVPPLDEYIKSARISVAYVAMTTAFFVGIEDAGIEEFEWSTRKPKISEAGNLIIRLMNDIVSHEFEQKRGHCASSVECYVKEHGVTEKEAVKALLKTSAEAWKDINEDCLKPTAIPMHLLNVHVNNTRATDVIYEYNDAYTNGFSLKDRVTSLFVEKIPL